MIHFDIEERYQDELTVGSAISRREGIVLSVLVHAGVIAFMLFGPGLPWFELSPEELEQQRQEQILREARQDENRTFVFVEPPRELIAPKPPERAPLSDRDRQAQAQERAQRPENPLPFSRGNSAERTESETAERARGAETPEPPVPPEPEPEPQPQPQQQARVIPPGDEGLSRPPEVSRPRPSGALGDALRNFERYVKNQTFSNPQGGVNSPGSEIQFDTKGVDFGWWIRRFVAQVRRNWFVPNAAFTFRGHVVLQFNIHKDGRITDLVIVKPAEIEGFTRAAYNAILGSNPTEPLPPEYPDEKALFTVTFYYNEQPPL